MTARNLDKHHHDWKHLVDYETLWWLHYGCGCRQWNSCLVLDASTAPRRFLDGALQLTLATVTPEPQARSPAGSQRRHSFRYVPSESGT